MTTTANPQQQPLTPDGILAAPCHQVALPFWDGRLYMEKEEMMLARHQQAKYLCRQCPLLEACSRYLERMEEQRMPVDGVVAGRYYTPKKRRRRKTKTRETPSEPAFLKRNPPILLA